MGEDEAARVIQAGFKNLKRRNTGSSIVTVVPNGNGTTAGEGELVVMLMPADNIQVQRSTKRLPKQS